MRTGQFSLVKWYMDCVSDAGEVVILYCAGLRWRGIQASLGSLFVARPNEAPSTTTSLGRFSLGSDPGRISIEHPRLKLNGTWNADATPFRRTVYEEERGQVEWNCMQPRSQVSVRIGDRTLTGLGYAECLTVTVSPWRLPMRELRWGRFVAPEHTLAWVDWSGPYSTSIAYFDSRPCALRSVAESKVDIGDAWLAIAPGVSLRSGRLSSTILPGASGLRRLFPSALFHVDERKSLSPGTLTVAGRSCQGWVIHEVVKWEL